MSSNNTFLKSKLSDVSAKTLSLGAKQFLRSRNEQKIKLQEEYRYDRLSTPRSIRLVRIHHGSDTDAVSCDVFEQSLDAESPFETLSYTWDIDPEFEVLKFDFVFDKKKEERPILCNGKTRHVTMNLYHALTELRRRKWQVPIWADQICINQHDSNEKTAQIALMVDIYRSAQCVNIWLGKITMVMNTAVSFIEALPDEPVKASTAVVTHTPTPANTKLVGNTMEAINRGLNAASLVAGTMGDQWSWFQALRVIGRQWFVRAWTLQEFLVASDIRFMMGDRDISASAFVKAARQMVEFYTNDPFSTQIGLNIAFLSIRTHLDQRARLLSERQRYRDGKRYSAEEYLGVIRIRKATEAKDMVIAGAALMNNNLADTIDYKATTLEIYTTFAQCLWPEAGIFSLSLVGGTVRKVEGLATWAPDVSMNLRPKPLKYCGCPTFEAKVPFEGQAFELDGKKLRISVANFDIVRETGEGIWSWTQYIEDPYNEDNKNKLKTSGTSQTERFGLMFALLNRLGTTYKPTGEHTMDAFWKTLIGSFHLNDESGETVWRDRFNHWFAFILLTLRTTFREEKEKYDKPFQQLMMTKKKKWLVQLLADWPQLEQRVSSFLDYQEKQLGEGGDKSASTLRKTIATIAKRLWGTETIDEVGSWSYSITEALSAVRGQEFYEPISVFERQFETVYDGRRIFTTESGYLGTGAEDVRAGDCIVLVAGADVPYILRPVPGEEKTFNLVSEAYVHGIMSGGANLKAKGDFESVTLI